MQDYRGLGRAVDWFIGGWVDHGLGNPRFNVADYPTVTVSGSKPDIVGQTPHVARIDLKRCSPRVARDGMNTVSFIAQRPEGVRS